MFWPSFLSTFLSQTPPSPTAEQIELLTQQINFLQDANTRMATSFSQFVTLINAVVVVVGVFLGILGFRTRQEIKQSLDEMVRVEVNKQLANTVQAQVEDLDRMIRRETIVGQTSVAYLLPTKSQSLPAEYQLLSDRGYQMTWFPYDPDRRLPSGGVLVLDLITPNLPEEQQEAIITAVGQKILNQTSQPPVLVIYLRGRRSGAVDALPISIYYVPANGRGTLVGAVTDAAQVAYALRQHS